MTISAQEHHEQHSHNSMQPISCQLIYWWCWFKDWKHALLSHLHTAMLFACIHAYTFSSTNIYCHSTKQMCVYPYVSPVSSNVGPSLIHVGWQNELRSWNNRRELILQTCNWSDLWNPLCSTSINTFMYYIYCWHQGHIHINSTHGIYHNRTERVCILCIYVIEIIVAC